MWQVFGAHGYIEPARAVAEMFAYHDAGFTTWDLADHYGPAEDFIGEFRREFAARNGPERLLEIQAFTKWVPRPGRITRRMVEDAIGRSLSRMGVKCLDLLQFHWGDYDDASYLDALKHLADLQREGQVRHLALTNFDAERLRIITDHGIRIVSNQVQYSLVDRRPEAAMAAFCRDPGERRTEFPPPRKARPHLRGTDSRRTTSSLCAGLGFRQAQRRGSHDARRYLRLVHRGIRHRRPEGRQEPA
jgi:aryl-alcohol dehydrogenase-like predicted oxidoreductase